MPYLPGPILMAYQVTVSFSCSASGSADFRNSSTSFSLPGRASSWAQIASLLMVVPPPHQMRGKCVWWRLLVEESQRAFENTGVPRPSRVLCEKAGILTAGAPCLASFARRGDFEVYNRPMSLTEQIQKDIVTA